MCYVCLHKQMVACARLVVAERHCPTPSTELKDEYDATVSTLAVAATWPHKENPISHAISVVATQMSEPVIARTLITPLEMYKNMRRVLVRMQTVDAHDPHSSAISGVGAMTSTLVELDAILNGAAQCAARSHATPPLVV
jgi:hypothetical protein